MPKHRLLGGWYVNVYADKGPNNIVVVCKSHYVDCLIKELYTGNSFVNPTYTPTTLTKEEILDNHRSVLCSFGISTKNWIYHHSTGFLNYTSVLTNSYIAGSAKCSTKPLSKLLTCILSAVTTGLQNYCDTRYTRGGMNQMWILKNSKYMLEYIQSRPSPPAIATGAWGMDFVSSSPLFSTTPPFFQNFHINHSFFKIFIIIRFFFIWQYQ